MSNTQLLKEQMNAGSINQDFNSERDNAPLVEYEKIERTPFTMVKQDGYFFITIGNYLLTQRMLTYEDAMLQLEINKWEIVTNLITLIVRTMNENVSDKNDKQE